MSTGTFDKDEFKFECKRDEEAAKELEEIQKIRDKWKGWLDKRLIGHPKLDEDYKLFAKTECDNQIKALRLKR